MQCVKNNTHLYVGLEVCVCVCVCVCGGGRIVRWKCNVTMFDITLITVKDISLKYKWEQGSIGPESTLREWALIPVHVPVGLMTMRRPWSI